MVKYPTKEITMGNSRPQVASAAFRRLHICSFGSVQPLRFNRRSHDKSMPSWFVVFLFCSRLIVKFEDFCVICSNKVEKKVLKYLNRMPLYFFPLYQPTCAQHKFCCDWMFLEKSKIIVFTKCLQLIETVNKI